jgi:hypothetical protein
MAQQMTHEEEIQGRTEHASSFAYYENPRYIQGIADGNKDPIGSYRPRKAFDIIYAQGYAYAQNRKKVWLNHA